MKTYVCTCGTSIATKKRIDLDRFDRPLAEWNQQRECIEATKDQIADALNEIDFKSNIDDTSAEIKSLVKMGIEKEDKVLLLTTDTIDGRLCAEAVKEFLIKRELSAENSVTIKEIIGLQAKDAKRFQAVGLKNLLDYLMTLDGQNIIFNVTGGFKSVVPYVTLFGMLHGKTVKYIFEDSDELLSIDQVPVTFDMMRIQEFIDKLDLINQKGTVSETDLFREVSSELRQERYEPLVIRNEDGKYEMSAAGYALYKKLKTDEQYKNLAIMFTDIVGFTDFCDKNKNNFDAVAKRLRLHHNAVFPAILQFGGRVIKSTGDGILARFDSAEKAVKAGVEIHKRLGAQSIDASENEALKIKIGIHYGPCFIAGSDVFGDTVNTAARVTDQAAGGIHLITEEVKNEITQIEGVKISKFGEYKVKNIKRPLQFFQIQE